MKTERRCGDGLMVFTAHVGRATPNVGTLFVRLHHVAIRIKLCSPQNRTLKE